jgi:uncharacterized integral membrane protein (TIGR00697 family)
LLGKTPEEYDRMIKKFYATIKNEKEFVISLSLISGYLLIQILANLTVSKQISLYEGLSIPVGSLIFAVSFTWIDLINEYFGKFKARFIVIASIAVNILTTIWLQFYIWVPGSPQWNESPERQSSIEFVFGGYWRFYMAGVLTNFVVENMDISIFHYLKYKRPQFPKWGRSMVSNTLSAPLDATLFATLAFIGSMSSSLLLSIIITSALYKLVVAYISIPILYLVKAKN